MSTPKHTWEIGDVVEIAPHLWVEITGLETTAVGTVIQYKLAPPRWSRWQRIRLWFGWRPEIGY